ncbi:MAG: DUF885 domain-containing protein [Chloroflexota bacterium]
MTEPRRVGAEAAVRLLHVADAYWTAQMADHPLYATAIGDRRYLTALGPNDLEALGRSESRLRTFVAKVEEIPDQALAAPDRITRAALLDELRYELALVGSGTAAWAVDPLDGPQVELLNVASYQPLATPQDGAAAVARWREMGPWIDRHVERLRSTAREGLVAPRSLVDSVVDELDDLLATADEAWPLYALPTADRPRWSALERMRFSNELADAIRDGIRPAFERQRAFLADELRPIARPDDRAGLAHVPGGEAAYRLLAAGHTTLDLTPAAIHEIGIEEIGRVDAEFAELGGRLLGVDGTAATLDRLRHDPALRFPTRDEVRETAEASLRRATAAIPAWFGRLPQAPCHVVVMGDHEAKHSTIAYYRQPAADGSRPGSYYINTTLPETRPRYEAEALAFHEAVPGHHLQLAIAQELTDLPAFRRFGGATAFIEGWALYTERLAQEMDLYSGPLDRFGILSFDAWRASRLVVDTGMHALGWTRGQAIDYMLAHTALAENNIVNEVDRYLAMPGQALAYKAGQLEIVRLRRTAEAALGGRFEIRGFHDAVLGDGAVGLGTLGGIVQRWIEGSAAERR